MKKVSFGRCDWRAWQLLAEYSSDLQYSMHPTRLLRRRQSDTKHGMVERGRSCAIDAVRSRSVLPPRFSSRLAGEGKARQGRHHHGPLPLPPKHCLTAAFGKRFNQESSIRWVEDKRNMEQSMNHTINEFTRPRPHKTVCAVPSSTPVHGFRAYQYVHEIVQLNSIERIQIREDCANNARTEPCKGGVGRWPNSCYEYSSI